MLDIHTIYWPTRGGVGGGGASPAFKIIWDVGHIARVANDALDNIQAGLADFTVVLKVSFGWV